jgi:hypothetical protein
MEVVNRKQTFLQMLTCQAPEKEVTYYNPLKLGKSAVITLQYPEYEKKDFHLDRVYECTRHLNDRTYTHAAYDLRADDHSLMRLLAIPIKGATVADAYAYALLLLKLDNKMDWNDDMRGVLQDACENKKWIVDDDGKDDDGNQVKAPFHDEYRRCNDLSVPYEADVADIEDDDGDGVFSAEEVRVRPMTYYDFSREVEDAPGAVSTEYFIIEKDGKSNEDGFLTMWKGDSIDPSRVVVL